MRKNTFPALRLPASLAAALRLPASLAASQIDVSGHGVWFDTPGEGNSDYDAEPQLLRRRQTMKKT